MEKRKCIRFESISAVSVRILEPKDIKIHAVVKDVSRIGLSLFVNKPLRKGQKLSLEIIIPSRKNPIKTVTDIKWAEKRQDSCIVGVEFLEVTKSDMSTLLDFLYKEWKSHLPNLKF